jgi:hypothetical protein
VVAAASYEARVFGVRSAMPGAQAQRLCPQLIFVPPRFEVYREVSRQIRAIFADYTPLIEPLSLDEAYLDVTQDTRGIGSATHIAQLIRARIKADTGLTASAGVSYNKFIAKLASDQNKPDGLCVIRPGEGAIRGRPARAALPRRGAQGAEKMAALGIATGRICARKTCPSCVSISERWPITSIARRAASTCAGCAPTARANPWAASAPSSATSPPDRACARLWRGSSIWHGAISRRPARGGGR